MIYVNHSFSKQNSEKKKGTDKKVKWTLLHALRLCTGRTAHRGSGGIALPFHEHGTRRGEWSASHSGRSLRSKKSRYPLYRRLGGPQDRSGYVRKISPHRDSIPDRRAHSQLLYQLRYPVNKKPCPRRDSNPLSRSESGRSPTP
jgi:hypothetical protein